MSPPEHSLTDLAHRIIDSATSGTTYVVSIDGPSGSGKTSFSQALRERIEPARTVGVLHVDEFVPGWEGLADVVPVLRDDVLGPLKRGGSPRARLWDWYTDQPGDWAAFDWARPPRCDVLLVEGCASGSRPVAPYVDRLLWVDAPEAVRYERAMDRDGGEYAPWWDTWSRQERELYAREGTASRADDYVEATADGWRVSGR